MTTPSANGFINGNEIHEFTLSSLSKWTFWWTRHFWAAGRTTSAPGKFKLSPELQAQWNAQVLTAHCDAAPAGRSVRRWIMWQMFGARMLVANLLWLVAFALWLLATFLGWHYLVQTVMVRETVAAACLARAEQLMASKVWNIVDFGSVDWVAKSNLTTAAEVVQLQQANFEYWLAAAAFVGCLGLGVLARAAVTSMLMRASTMLRGACVAALHEKMLQQSAAGLQNIGALLSENGDKLDDLLLHGTLLYAKLAALACCTVLGLFTVRVPLVWSVFAIVIAALQLLNYGRLLYSASQLRLARQFWNGKFSFLSAVVAVTRRIDGRQLRRTEPVLLAHRFTSIVTQQLAAVYKAELVRPIEPIGFAILMLLVIQMPLRWTQWTPDLSAVEMMLMFTVPQLLADCARSLDANHNGCAVLDDLLALIRCPAASSAAASDNRQPSTSRDEPLLSLLNAKFELDTPSSHAEIEQLISGSSKDSFAIRIKELRIASPQRTATIVGITGRSRRRLRALPDILLGRVRPQIADEFRLAGAAAAFCSEQPYLLDEMSVWHNIVGAAGDWNEPHYRHCLEAVGLPVSAQFQTQLVHTIDGVEQLQRIAMARALYNQDDRLLILENPFAFAASGEDATAMAGFCASLRQQGRSAVIITQRAAVLGQCDAVHLLQPGGLLSGGLTPLECAEYPFYAECTEDGASYGEAQPQTAADAFVRFNVAESASAMEAALRLGGASAAAAAAAAAVTPVVKVKHPFNVLVVLLLLLGHTAVEGVTAISIGTHWLAEAVLAVFVPAMLGVLLLLHLALMVYAQASCRQYNLDWNRRVVGEWLARVWNREADEARSGGGWRMRTMLLDDFGNAQHWTFRYVYGQSMLVVCFIYLARLSHHAFICGALLTLIYLPLLKMLGKRTRPMHSALLNGRHRLTAAIWNDLEHHNAIRSVTEAKQRIIRMYDEWSAECFVHKSMIAGCRVLCELLQYAIGLSVLFWLLADPATQRNTLITAVYLVLLIVRYTSESIEIQDHIRVTNTRLTQIWSFV